MCINLYLVLVAQLNVTPYLSCHPWPGMPVTHLKSCQEHCLVFVIDIVMKSATHFFLKKQRKLPTCSARDAIYVIYTY